MTSPVEREALLLLARTAERALHDSERARLADDGTAYRMARRRCAMLLERLIMALEKEGKSG